jgi:Co/Zn/Cd efflux system component
VVVGIEAVRRIQTPTGEDVDMGVVLVFAIIGLVFDLVSMWLFHGNQATFTYQVGLLRVSTHLTTDHPPHPRPRTRPRPTSPRASWRTGN